MGLLGSNFYSSSTGAQQRYAPVRQPQQPQPTPMRGQQMPMGGGQSTASSVFDSAYNNNAVSQLPQGTAYNYAPPKPIGRRGMAGSIADQQGVVSGNPDPNLNAQMPTAQQQQWDPNDPNNAALAGYMMR